MLEIPSSYHCEQFQGELINQTCKNGKIYSFGPNFSLFWSKFGTLKFFLWVLHLQDVILCCKLQISDKFEIANYKSMQFQKKLMHRTCKSHKKRCLGLNFDSFSPNLHPKKLFHEFYRYYML